MKSDPFAVKDAINALNLVGQKVNRLEVTWIKAHVGHPGNEHADKMAREAINQTENIHGLFPPYSHFKFMSSWELGHL